MDSTLTIFAWPITVIVICIVGFLIFRAQIANLINRTKKVGKAGLETYEMQTAEAEKKRGVDEFFKSFDNRLLVDIETEIARDLEARNINDLGEKVKTLTRALAAGHIAFHFNDLLNTIWSSQLKMLRFINSRSEGVLLETLKGYYDSGQEQFPQLYESYSFDSWFGFLVAFKVVNLQDGRVRITLAGREFLKFLVETGKPEPIYG